MSSLATLDLTTAPQTAPPERIWSGPAWSPVQPAADGRPGLSDEQLALDNMAAEQAGMGATEVATLGIFGLRPSEMDTSAAQRISVGLKRLQALLACEAGNDVGCALAGPGLVGHELAESAGGDSSEDLVVEDAEFTLRLSTRTTASGETERVLFYQDIDGTHLSGNGGPPSERISQDRTPDAPAPDQEGLASFLEGALLGDFSDNSSWSAIAGQIAIGFVPYAGQVADARDLVAAGVDLYEGKEGAAWRLALSAVAVVPGVGDAIKAGGKAALGKLGAMGNTLVRHEDELVEVVEAAARHQDDASALAEDVAARLAAGLGPDAFARLSARLGPDGLAKLARGMDAETLARVSGTLDADTLASLVGKGLDGHAIRDLADGMGEAELKALAAAGSADEIAEAATRLAKERLSGQAELRREYLGGRAAPGKGNAAAAELTLDNGQRLSTEATSKAAPLDRPRTAAEGPDPATGRGGHYEPSAHADQDWIRDSDSEFKILSDLTDQLVKEGWDGVAGKVRLYTERLPCDSCARIIAEFETRFPGINVEVFSDFTANGAPL